MSRASKAPEAATVEFARIIFEARYEAAHGDGAREAWAGLSDGERQLELEAGEAVSRRVAEILAPWERITTAWTRGMYAARIDCIRGDVKAAVECLSEGLDGYDGTEWNGTETGTEWWERTKAEEGL